MTNTDSEIEAMARAICFESQWPSCREEGIGRMPSCLAPTCGCNHIAESLAARTASRKWMEENGYVVVPREPTLVMKLAVNQAQPGADGLSWYPAAVRHWETGHKAIVAMISALQNGESK